MKHRVHLITQWIGTYFTASNFQSLVHFVCKTFGVRPDLRIDYGLIELDSTDRGRLDG